MRILVTGASGLLGLNLCLHLAEEHIIFGTFFERELKEPPFQAAFCDLKDSRSIEALIDKTKPEFLINCAAMANVDSCESRTGNGAADQRGNAWQYSGPL